MRSSTCTRSERRRPESIAIVGSSGGGAATLGHTDPVELLESIQNEFGKCTRPPQDDDRDGDDVPRIRHALYVSLHSGRGLDHADDGAPATLHAVGCGYGSDEPSSALLRVRSICAGPLHQVNAEARRLDATYIAKSIENGEIDGLICISADPTGINSASMRAAAQCQMPVTGSGGSSLSAAVAQLGVNLVGNAGGSVATTTYTRAASYVYALVGAWSTCNPGASNTDTLWTYSPFMPSKVEKGVPQVRPTTRSVLDSCVPAFVAVCVTCRLLELLAHWLEVHSSIVDSMDSAPTRDVYQVPMDSSTAMKMEELIARLYWQLQFHALPTVCAVISATTYAPEMGSVVLMAASVASVACGGSALAGLLAGCAVAYMSKRALFACVKLNVPATMTNVLVAGGVGCAVALGMGMSGLVVVLNAFGSLLRSLVRLSFLVPHPPGATPLPGIGFFVGWGFHFGSKVGWYHSIFLPIILIEMEKGEGSVLGAVDECTLCLVSAGICMGNIVAEPLQSSASDMAISKRGLKINLLCGDFIEAAYPFMERSSIINNFAYLASGVSTEILLHHRPEHVLSSAYIPFGLSIVLSHDMKRMTMACAAAFCISFVGAVLGNVIGQRSDEKKYEGKNE